MEIVFIIAVIFIAGILTLKIVFLSDKLKNVSEELNILQANMRSLVEDRRDTLERAYRRGDLLFNLITDYLNVEVEKSVTAKLVKKVKAKK